MGTVLPTTVYTGSVPTPQSPFETPVFGLVHPVSACMAPGTGTVSPPVPPEPPVCPEVPVGALPAEVGLSVRPHPINKRDGIASAVMPAESRKDLQAAVAHRMTMGGTTVIFNRTVPFRPTMLTNAFIDRDAGNNRVRALFVGSITGTHDFRLSAGSRTA